MMHPNVLHNGAVLPMDEACLTPGQTGLFSGWGVFTTMRLYAGRPFALDRHWRRLRRDAALMHVALPVTPEALASGLARLVAANGVGDGAARVYFVRNRVGWWHGAATGPETDLVACTSDLPPSPDAVALTVRAHGVRSDHPLSGAKTLSWAANAWPRLEAAARGFDEVVLLNERGEVAECASANVFCVRDGVALTPPLSSGCLDGITREILLELARDHDLPVREAVLRPEDLHAADEAFITSTSRELLPVARIEGRALPHVGTEITRALLTAFQSRVRAMLAPDEA